MKLYTRAGALLLTILLLVGSLTGCTSLKPGEIPEDVSKITDPYYVTAGMKGDTVVATAGDQNITLDQILYHVATIADNYMSYYYYFGMTELPWDTEADGMTMAQSVLEDALEMSALYSVLPKIGTAEGVTADEEELTALSAGLDEMAAELGGEEMLNYSMWQSALTRGLYTRLVTSSLHYSAIQNKYYGEGGSNTPADADILAYAEDTMGYYRTKHILLKTVDTNEQITKEDGSAGFAPLDEAVVAEKYTRAEEILAQLQAADDAQALMDELMLQYSEDQDSNGNVNGTDGYVVTPGQMTSAYEEAALALEYGQLSGIVESEYGYHIILRLPLSAGDYREDYTYTLMDEMQQRWMEENPIVKTAAFDKIDAKLFYENLTQLRADLAAALDSAESNAGAASSGGASSSASSSGAG